MPPDEKTQTLEQEIQAYKATFFPPDYAAGAGPAETLQHLFGLLEAQRTWIAAAVEREHAALDELAQVATPEWIENHEKTPNLRKEAQRANETVAKLWEQIRNYWGYTETLLDFYTLVTGEEVERVKPSQQNPVTFYRETYHAKLVAAYELLQRRVQDAEKTAATADVKQKQVTSLEKEVSLLKDQLKGISGILSDIPIIRYDDGTETKSKSDDLFHEARRAAETVEVILGRRDTEVAGLAAERDGLKGEIGKLEVDLTIKTEEYAALITEYERVAAERKELKAALGEHQTGATKKGEEYDTLKADYNAVVAERDRLREEKSGLETTLKAKTAGGEEDASPPPEWQKKLPYTIASLYKTVTGKDELPKDSTPLTLLDEIKEGYMKHMLYSAKEKDVEQLRDAVQQLNGEVEALTGQLEAYKK